MLANRRIIHSPTRNNAAAIEPYTFLPKWIEQAGLQQEKVNLFVYIKHRMRFAEASHDRAAPFFHHLFFPVATRSSDLYGRVPKWIPCPRVKSDSTEPLFVWRHTVITVQLHRGDSVD